MDITILNGLTSLSISLLKVIMVLLIGFVTGNLLKQILMKFFEITGILNITKNNRIGKTLTDLGYHGGFLGLIIDILKWTIYLIALITSFEIMGLYNMSVILKELLMFIPKLLSGIVIVLLGILIADFIGKIIKDSSENKNKPHLNEINSIASEFIQSLLYFITIIMALQVIGINMIVIMIVLTIFLATAGLFIIVAMQDFAPNYAANIYLHSINLKKGDHISSARFSGVIEEIGRINTKIETDHGIMRIPNRELIINGFEKIKTNNYHNNHNQNNNSKNEDKEENNDKKPNHKEKKDNN